MILDLINKRKKISIKQQNTTILANLVCVPLNTTRICAIKNEFLTIEIKLYVYLKLPLNFRI